MAPSTTSPPPTAQSDKSTSPLWKLADIPGKGKGLVVSSYITPGTLLLSEAPIIKTDVITSMDMNITESDLSNALNKLPKADQEAVLALHDNFQDGYPLAGIVRSNAYPLGADADVGGIFVDISRINHSCAPNSVQYWNPILERLMIHAIKPIAEGDEITTSYHEGGTSSRRKDLLKTNFGFECACELCSLSGEHLEDSDRRLERAGVLDKILGDSALVYKRPEEVLKAARELSEIFEKVKIKDGRVTRLWFDCFQAVNLHGDAARARCFAKYFVDGKKIAEGADSLNVLEMKRFVKCPEDHGSYERAGKWKTAKSEVPKGLKVAEFKRWLFRESV